MSRRIAREKKTVSLMIDMYCRNHHGRPGDGGAYLCDECSRLRDYALKKIDRCPFHELKPVCSKCTVHCYQTEMREDIRKVMRYAGPRMLRRHPIMGVRHVYQTIRYKP